MKMNSKLFIWAIVLAFPVFLSTEFSAQALTISSTFTDANSWQEALTNSDESSSKDFTLEHRSLAGLDCSPYTNGRNYLTLSNFCNTGITSQLRVNDVLSDPETTLATTNLTTHGIDGSGYSVSYGETGPKNLSVVWTFPAEIQGLFLDFTSSAFSKDTQIAVTGTDGITQIVAVPNRTDTWGFITDTAISTVEYIATRRGDENFSVASLTSANTGSNETTEVPTPLLIPGFLGLAFAIGRRQKALANGSSSGH